MLHLERNNNELLEYSYCGNCTFLYWNSSVKSGRYRWNICENISMDKKRAEVKKVSIYEYDQEKHLRMEREDAKEEGRNELLEEQVRKKLLKNKSPELIAEELEENIVTIKSIIEKITR